jgi:hypothetical protein
MIGELERSLQPAGGEASQNLPMLTISNFQLGHLRGLMKLHTSLMFGDAGYELLG